MRMSQGPGRRPSRLLWSDLVAIACIVAVLVLSLLQNWF
jgi:hypothetical protein